MNVIGLQANMTVMDDYVGQFDGFQIIKTERNEMKIAVQDALKHISGKRKRTLDKLERRVNRAANAHQLAKTPRQEALAEAAGVRALAKIESLRNALA